MQTFGVTASHPAVQEPLADTLARLGRSWRGRIPDG